MKRLFASVISCVLILSMICSGLTVFATTITGAVDTDNFVRGVMYPLSICWKTLAHVIIKIT